ncbi:hypothetical protein KAH94_04860, partial [bacterium]|nr:hypothetical protein [bacterium]
MKFKKLFLGFFIIILLITVFVSALTTTEIFFDGFEADNFATIWTSDAIYTRQAIASNTDGGGTFSIETEGAITDATMEITTAQNISNQTTCNLTSR